MVCVARLRFAWPRAGTGCLAMGARSLTAHCLQGRSGSGKSTLLGLLAGVLLPRTGEVVLLVRVGLREETLHRQAPQLSVCGRAAVGYDIAKPTYRTIARADLMPKDWSHIKQFRDLNLSKLADSDLRAIERFGELRETCDHAPSNDGMNGQAVRARGYLFPLEEPDAGMTEFPVVPYLGDCNHSPPPPSNQIIYVLAVERLETHVATNRDRTSAQNVVMDERMN